MPILPPFLDRLRGLIPAGWAAPDSGAPLLTAVLGGISDTFSWIIDRQAYTVAQTRILTASTFWLDLIAWDFFGPRFMRRTAERDDVFRTRIVQEIFRPRNTRAAISQVLYDTTGVRPEIVELWNPGDCGVYDNGTLAYAGDSVIVGPLIGHDTNAAAYDTGPFAYVTPSAAVDGAAGAGRWGSYDFPNQMLITAYRGIVNEPGIEGCGGYDAGNFSYDGPALRGAGFIGPAAPFSSASDAEIYGALSATVAAGCIAWTAIRNAPSA